MTLGMCVLGYRTEVKIFLEEPLARKHHSRT